MTRETVKLDLIRKIEYEVITDFDVEFLEEHYDEIDVETYINEAYSKYECSEWDKASPINGVDAAVVLNTPPFNLEGWNGKTLLIKDVSTQRYQIMQPMTPEAEGLNEITEETFERVKLEILDPMCMGEVAVKSIKVLKEIKGGN